MIEYQLELNNPVYPVLLIIVVVVVVKIADFLFNKLLKTKEKENEKAIEKLESISNKLGDVVSSLQIIENNAKHVACDIEELKKNDAELFNRTSLHHAQLIKHETKFENIEKRNK